MTRIFEIIRFYSLDEIKLLIGTNEDFPTYQIWCYDIIQKNGFNTSIIKNEKNTFLNKLGNKIGIPNLQQQINCFRLTQKNDIVFAPFIRDVSFLALLRILKIYKTPIIAISNYGFVPYQKNILKYFKLFLKRKLYLSGLDKVLFLNQKMYDYSNTYSTLPRRHGFIQHWGIDFHFYNSYTQNQKINPTNDFLFSTGGTNRDFETLIKAFTKLSFKLKIASKFNLDIPELIPLPSNVEVIAPVPLKSYGIIRNEYFNCRAVAIPLIKELDFYPTGSTVLFEAMAMGKAIIGTKNKAYPFDIEEEKIGINVDYGDIDGWINAVNYLIDHPEEAKEMGARAKLLCQNKYNYNLFSNEIIEHLNYMSKSTMN